MVWLKMQESITIKINHTPSEIIEQKGFLVLSKILLNLPAKIISYEGNTNQGKYSINLFQESERKLFKWDGVIWGSRVLGANSLWTASDELQDFEASSISITTQSLSDIVVAHAVLVFWFVSAIHRECFARAKQQQFHSAPTLSATVKANAAQKLSKFCWRVES